MEVVLKGVPTVHDHTRSWLVGYYVTSCSSNGNVNHVHFAISSDIVKKYFHVYLSRNILTRNSEKMCVFHNIFTRKIEKYTWSHHLYDMYVHSMLDRLYVACLCIVRYNI